MKKFSKLVSVLSAAAVLGIVLAGCSSSAGSGNAGTGAASQEEASAGEKTAGSNPVMLKWIQIGPVPKHNDEVIKAMNDYSISKIGVGVDVTYLDYGIWRDKVTAMVNSGEYWDLMFTNNDEYTAGINLGAFADITDMLGDVPALKESIPDKVWNGVKVNDKIYSVPTYKDSSETQYWVWDKGLVDKYNIDYKNIHTPDDLDPALYTLQDAIRAGEIPDAQYALTIAWDGINGFLMNYEAPSPVTVIGVRYDDKEYKVVNVFEQDDVMDTLKHMHKWFTDGLINPDAATTDRGPSWEPVASTQGFPGAEVSWAISRGNKETVAEPFAGPLYSTTSILGSVNVVSAASKYKAEALKYLELMNTDKTLRNLFAYGIEGTDYTKNDDGTIVRADDCYTPATYSQATYFLLYPVSPNPPDQWDKVKEWNDSAQSSVLLGFNFDKTPVDTQMANCTLIMDRYKKELYTGTSDPEEAVPAMYADLKKAGLEDIRTEYENQIKAWLGK